MHNNFKMQNQNIDLSKLYADNNLLPTYADTTFGFCGYLDVYISLLGLVDVGKQNYLYCLCPFCPPEFPLAFSCSWHGIC
jgi:hypothetical protein